MISEPAVMGAIGFVPRDIADWIAQAGPGLRAVHRGGNSILVASRELQLWSSEGASGWYWGQALEPANRVRSWQDAALYAGSAGFSIDSGGWPTVHTDRSGTIPVFIRRMDSYVLFASSIDILVQAVGGQLHTDEAAWAEILAGGMIMSDRTPFEEIRRLRPDGWCRVTDRGVATGAPDIAFAPETRLKGDATTAAELIERLAAVVDRTKGMSITLPLSGGWDSRLLAAVVAGLHRDVRTLTASDEFGRDDEPEWAAEVARRLRLPNEQLDPPSDWWEAFVASVSVQDFLTSKNHWLLPLAQRIAGLPGTLLDGLAGDVLVKMNLPAWMSEAAGPKVVDGMRTRFAPPLEPSEMLVPATAAHLDDLVDLRFKACWKDVEDHPAALHLYNYYLRTPTGVGLSPTMLLSPSAPLAVPFLAHETLDFALSVDPRDKKDGAWYRAVMAQLPNAIGEIPSTNDTRPLRRTKRRVDQAAHVLQRIVEALHHDSVRPAVGPRLRAAIASGSLLDTRHVSEQRVVRGLALFSLWTQRYGHRLADPHFPAVSRPARAASPFVASSHVVPTNAPSDKKWIDAQNVPPSAAFVLAGPEPAAPLRADADSGPGKLRTVSILGRPLKYEQLEGAIDAAAGLLEPDGRLLLSLTLPEGSPGPAGLGLMGICELLSMKLDIVHAESSARRLRVIARVADRDVLPCAVAPELLLAGVGGLEKRIELLASEVARLEDENSALEANLARVQRESIPLMTPDPDSRASQSD